MSDTTIVIIGVVVILAIIAIVIGRRLTSWTITVGGLKGELKGHQPDPSEGTGHARIGKDPEPF
jgi:hypothetical protein